MHRGKLGEVAQLYLKQNQSNQVLPTSGKQRGGCKTEDLSLGVAVIQLSLGLNVLLETH